MSWKNTLLDRISNLLTVKTIITSILSVVFAILALRGDVEAKDVLTVYLVIVGFYFGTQHQNQQQENEYKSDNI